MAANNVSSTSNSNKENVLINVKRFFGNRPLMRGWYHAVSSSKKDLSKRMSTVSEVSASDMQEQISSCGSVSSHVSHAASMPVLSCSNCLQQRQDVDRLRLEVAGLKRELKLANQALQSSREAERSLRDRLSSEAQKQIKLSDRFEDVTLGNDRPTALVQQYGALFSQTRVDALDSLDAMQELSELDNLKNKLLFSVIVLSFRHCQQRIQLITEKVTSAVGVKKVKTVTADIQRSIEGLEQSAMSFLRDSVNYYDIKTIISEVQVQIYSTLYDYPCLKQCHKLRLFIEESVRVAWKLCVQIPPCRLEFDCKKFTESKHHRFHSSNGASDTIRSYIWPSLHETKTGVCLYKGTVIT